MLILQNVSYSHPNKELLFEGLNLSLQNHEKIALIGNNGSGKSTLLKIIAGQLAASSGEVLLQAKPCYVPQIFGQFNHLTVAEAMGISEKIAALHQILNGVVTEENRNVLNDDWTIEERCAEALNAWQLDDIALHQKMESLSGGQKTKVFLAGMAIHQPEMILLDEPSNHLDTRSRAMLYDFIQTSSAAFLIVSHDRKLLNLLENICELDKRGITNYRGNYDFYVAQKELETGAFNQDLKATEKALRKAKEKERETLERQQKLDARGKKKQQNAGIATIMMNTLRNNAEKSTSKIKGAHSEKIDGISAELRALRQEIPDLDKMKFGFDDAKIHEGKILFQGKDFKLKYGENWLWKATLNLEIRSGERIALKGNNGSGKTTLINILTGALEPSCGEVYRALNKVIYIDQDYSLIKHKLSVYEQAQAYNESGLEEHEIKIRLNRFLFGKEDWDKPCIALSGGERMRLILCCLTISQQAPDMIILDEPTNNLDIQNIEILSAAINQYRGTLIVVSHDEHFLEDVGVAREIKL